MRFPYSLFRREGQTWPTSILHISVPGLDPAPTKAGSTAGGIFPLGIATKSNHLSVTAYRRNASQKTTRVAWRALSDALNKFLAAPDTTGGGKECGFAAAKSARGWEDDAINLRPFSYD